jgi:hypothetical protein
MGMSEEIIFREEDSKGPVDRIKSRNKAGALQEHVNILPHVKRAVRARSEQKGPIVSCWCAEASGDIVRMCRKRRGLSTKLKERDCRRDRPGSLAQPQGWDKQVPL